MPIYEYQCERCDNEFEDLVRLGTPDEEIECPSCGECECRRVLSVFSSQAGRSASVGGAAACGPSGGFS